MLTLDGVVLILIWWIALLTIAFVWRSVAGRIKP